MKYLDLKKIDKLYFGYGEIARAIGITPGSAKVSANRYVRQGYLVRVKRNLYILKDRWDRLSAEEVFTIANLIQVPSYISLMTAMSYHEVTTQIQRDFIESIAVKRTGAAEVSGRTFNFTRIDKRLYFGFGRENGFFIAAPEKAFLDAVYLKSLKKYNFDLSSIDFGKLDMAVIRRMAGKFPVKTQKALEEYGYFRKT